MEKGANLQGTPSERMDPNKISVKLSESAKSKVISTRIRVARNLSMFPLNTGGTRLTRIDICNLMAKVYKEMESDQELSGEMFLHSSMSDKQRHGLIDDHFLFRGEDSMQSASGYHADWPIGRGVFHNKDKTFVNWINEGDHLRIISMRQGGDIHAVFSLLSKGAKVIEEEVKKVTGSDTAFMMHPKVGAVTTCPTNLGTGMRGSVHLMIPKLIEKWGFEKIDEECRKRLCQVRGSSGEHSKVVDRVDISNWRRIGIPEYELVEDMINCVNWVVEQEDSIGKQKVEDKSVKKPNSVTNEKKPKTDNKDTNVTVVHKSGCGGC